MMNINKNFLLTFKKKDKMKTFFRKMAMFAKKHWYIVGVIDHIILLGILMLVKYIFHIPAIPITFVGIVVIVAYNIILYNVVKR